MTKINKLVMHGFKSFGKRVELNFGDKFNCILGPNGSGKSNVLDALCFVLGKSSAKSMRAEKSSNLIYNGGKSKKASKFAEVSIYFDNAHQEFPSDEKEIKLTRIVKQTGQGVYKINDEVRTRTQILELLSLAKIDPDGYNIILQGDIIKLCDMSPVQRREIIEEISGISVYEDKKKKAMNELARVDDKLKEAEIVLAEREIYLKELKKERNQAKKFRDLEGKIKTNKATYIHRKIEKKLAEKEEFDERVAKHTTKVAELTKELKELYSEISSRKKEISDIEQELEIKGSKEQVELHKVIELLKVDIATSKNRIQSIDEELEKIITRKNNLTKDIKEVEEKISTLQNENKEVTQQITARNAEQKNVEEKIQKFKNKHKLEDIDSIDKEVDTIDKEAEILQTEMLELRTTQQTLLREKDRLEIQVQNIDEKIAKVLNLEKENADQLNVLKQNKIEFKKSTLELNNLLNKDSEMAQELGVSRRRLMSANEELAKLNARNAGIKEHLGRDLAVKRIIEQKNTIQGIYGTISELGSVNEKYSQAVEVAAGGKIKSIVVESDTVAAKCINYLKQNKLGIASFVPLNKIRTKPENPLVSGILKQSGVHDKASSLVTFDAKFKKVFDWVFESTVIVQDVSTARHIGIGTTRMVTLDGDVVEASGAMQGGFRQKRKGAGFAQKEVTIKIKEYEQIQAQMSSTISRMERSKEDNEEKIIRLRELKANLEGEIIKMEKVLHLDSDDIGSSKKVKDDLVDQLTDIDARAEKMISTISQKNGLLAQNRIKKQALRNKITELRNPLLIAELNAFEQKKTELRESLIKLNSEISNINTQIDKHLIPEKDNLLSVIKGHEKEEDIFNKEKSQLTEKINSFNNTLKEKEVLELEFRKKFQTLFDQRQKLNNEISKREGKTFAFNEDLRKTEHKVNINNLEIAKLKAELAGLNDQFEPYKNAELDHEKSDQQLQREIGQFEKLVENLGTVNLKALEIYDNVEKEYNELVSKKVLLSSEKEDVLFLMNEIEDKKKVLFMKTFEVILLEFQKLFGQLSTKGDAFLTLDNPESPFEGGMDIKVKITGTKFLDIRSLSGGEKTMTALAFLFAVQEHEPASFYVLDEVDAALDKKNSERLADLVRSYCSKAQYVMISHNDGVIKKADNLYGVSMNQHGITDVVSLDINEEK